MQAELTMCSTSTEQTTAKIAEDKCVTEVAIFLLNSALLIAMFAMITLAASQIAIPL
jgi:hypothetical protein